MNDLYAIIFFSLFVRKKFLYYFESILAGSGTTFGFTTNPHQFSSNPDAHFWIIKRLNHCLYLPLSTPKSKGYFR